jgi:hypothetical protein
MHKLLPAFLGAAALAGCMGGTKQEVDWTKGNGCEKYFSETSRDMANCEAFVKAQEEDAKSKGTTQAQVQKPSVSLDKAGDEVKMTEGMKVNEEHERTLTE